MNLWTFKATVTRSAVMQLHEELLNNDTWLDKSSFFGSFNFLKAYRYAMNRFEKHTSMNQSKQCQSGTPNFGCRYIQSLLICQADVISRKNCKQYAKIRLNKYKKYVKEKLEWAVFLRGSEF